MNKWSHTTAGNTAAEIFPYPCKQKPQPTTLQNLLQIPSAPPQHFQKGEKKPQTHAPDFAQTEFVTMKAHKVMIFKRISLRAMSIFTF